MTKREKRVINAFVNCVNRGEFTFDYAITLIEDTDKYGYLTDEAKEMFYAEFETDVTEDMPDGEVIEETPTENITE